MNIGGDVILHDHTWNGLSIFLKGHYVEHVYSGGEMVKTPKRWFNFIPGEKFHTFSKIKRHTWTLFITGKRYKHYGTMKIGRTWPSGEQTLYYHRQPFPEEVGENHWIAKAYTRKHARTRNEWAGSVSYNKEAWGQ